MILNLHERWLLATMGVRSRQWRAYAQMLDRPAAPGEVDIAAQVGWFKLAKRRVADDLPALFDQLTGPSARPVRAVAYGRRRFRRSVILAAALHQAGVSPAAYAAGVAAGRRTLTQLTQASERDRPAGDGRRQT